MLLELPLLHVLPEKRVMQPLPDVESWRLNKLDVQKQGDNVVMSIDGRYTNFEGGYRLSRDAGRPIDRHFHVQVHRQQLLGP